MPLHAPLTRAPLAHRDAIAAVAAQRRRTRQGHLDLTGSGFERRLEQRHRRHMAAADGRAAYRDEPVTHTHDATVGRRRRDARHYCHWLLSALWDHVVEHDAKRALARLQRHHVLRGHVLERQLVETEAAHDLRCRLEDDRKRGRRRGDDLALGDGLFGKDSHAAILAGRAPFGAAAGQ